MKQSKRLSQAITAYTRRNSFHDIGLLTEVMDAVREEEREKIKDLIRLAKEISQCDLSKL